MKKVKVVQSPTDKGKTRDVRGERSPYRDYLAAEGTTVEPVNANPDQLEDNPDNNIWAQHPLSELAQETLEKLKPFMDERGNFPILSRRENQVYQLYIIGGFKREIVQKELKLKKSTVDTYLERIGKKLRTLLKTYE
jgi:DNA-binding NarL/FixJ family response regulator